MIRWVPRDAPAWGAIGREPKGIFKMRRILTASVLLLSLAGAAPSAPVGLRSLLIDPGVTASGMGYAYTAVADDPSALYWNPAGLTRGAPGYDLLLAHTEWFIDYRMEYAALCWRRGGRRIRGGDQRVLRGRDRAA